MQPLAEIKPDNINQEAFAAMLLTPKATCPPSLVGPSGKADNKRLSVYRNNVILSLTNALASIFPASERLIGVENFKLLAGLYIRQCPPTSPIINEYGRGLANFIADFQPLKKYPFLPDVVRLERLWLDAYHAQDKAPLAPSSLSQIPSEQLADIQFNLHPATRLFESSYAAASIFSKSRQKDDLHGFHANQDEYALITRPHLDVDVRIIPKSAFEFYAALEDGALLGQAAHIAAKSAANNNQEFDLTIALTTLLDAGALSGFELRQS